MTDILKLLSKPSQFTGEEKDWKALNFSFMAYVGAVDKIMAAEAVTAMKSQIQVNMIETSRPRSSSAVLRCFRCWSSCGRSVLCFYFR